MTRENAEDIVDAYEYFEDQYCVCFQGNPPCSKCTYSPSQEDYEYALQILSGKIL